LTEVEIFTDGACRGNPGPGGWAALLVFGTERKEVSGFEAATTNNRMELTAAIRGLGALKRRCAVKLYTDSKYVLQGLTEWLAHGRAPAGQESRPVAAAGCSRSGPGYSMVLGEGAFGT
jgi:ribonuclease HI